jgi:SAM-dependent methyltransferase
MSELLFLLAEFIFLLLVLQIVFFEISYKKVKKTNNMNWYLSLDKSFSYTRTGYMAFICFICYIISSEEAFLSLNWILYFVIFLALGIIADAIVQFLTLKYGQLRCKNNIKEAKELLNEINHLKDSIQYIEDYDESMKTYDEKAELQNYIVPDDHLAFLSVDQGKFASSFTSLPSVVYDVEPYGDIEVVKERLKETNIKPTTLTQALQMPFKDDKIDVIYNQLCNYDKNEIKRVLKPNGYFILNQNGTGNYKELVDMYMPFKINGEWNVETCSQSLESIGFKIIKKIENHGSIQFKSIEGLYTYFNKISPDLCDIDKYKNFYMSALKQIKEKQVFCLSTYSFLLVVKNEG